jgi:hypothetical protein
MSTWRKASGSRLARQTSSRVGRRLRVRSIEPLEQRTVLDASLQLIHNSPYDIIGTLDVYVDDVLFVDNFAFQNARPFVNLPAGQHTIELTGSGAANSNNPFYSLTANLLDNTSYIAAIQGQPFVAPGPGAIHIGLSPLGRTLAQNPANVDMLFVNGVPDSAPIDVVIRGGATLADDLAYPNFGPGYVGVAPLPYILDVTSADGALGTRSFTANLPPAAATAFVVLASDYVNPPPDVNGNPRFVLMAVFHDGAAFVLPEIIPTVTPSVSVAAASGNEGNTGTSPLFFTISLSTATSQTVSVAYSTSNGSATAGSDYNATSGTVTFGPGVTTRLITVVRRGDTVSEPNETFNLNLNTAINATIATPSVTGTILNDDGGVVLPALAVASRSLNEGNAGTTPFVFTVTLSTASAQQVTVGYATGTGTATAGTDYTATSGTLTFAPGTTSQLVTVQVAGDTTNEPNETFTLALSGATNATIATPSVTNTIQNDDGVPTLAVAGVSASEGNASTNPFVIPVILSAASSQQVTVAYATGTGTATVGTDYTATSGTLTFAPGATVQLVTVQVTGDTANEPNETFTLALSGATNATIATPTVTNTIQNDDPVPSLAVAGISASEGNAGTTPFVFTVSLAAASGQQVTVAYATSPGTAAAGSDYTAISGTLTFAPGVTTQLVTVQVAGDTTNEPNETFGLNLSAPVNATIATAAGTGTIQNDDAVPTLAITSVSLNEGNAGTTPFVFTVSLSAASSQEVTVAYGTSPGTATAGSDYTTTSGTLTFTPGSTTRFVTVQVAGDTTNEPNEAFSVNLAAPVNATLGTAAGTGTIQNDDGVPSLTVAGVSANEGNAGTTPFVFTVNLSAASSQPVTVAYGTGTGTATAGSDYTATSGTLTFAPGITTQLVTVQVAGDTANEPNETFTLALSGATSASIATPSVNGTIQNDDAVPSLAVAGVSSNEGNAGTTPFVFTVSLSAASGQQVTVAYATGTGTATAGSDYTATSGTLTFAPGITTQLVTVQVAGDTVAEPNETFALALSGATNATIGTSTGTGTIQNDDTAGPSTISFPSGFSGAASQFSFNSSATIAGGSLRLTNGFNQRASSYFRTPVDVTSFNTHFDFQLRPGSNPWGDGFTFVIQGNGLTSLGSGSSGLGYAGMGSSVAVKFDVKNNAGEGTNSTGLYTNGASPTSLNSVSLGSTGINLRSRRVFGVDMAYNGTTLTVTITDQTTLAQATQNYTVNIPSIIGASSAYVGFTGSTSNNTAVQRILNWTYTSGSAPAPLAMAAGVEQALTANAATGSPTATTLRTPTSGSTASTSSAAPTSTALAQTQTPVTASSRAKALAGAGQDTYVQDELLDLLARSASSRKKYSRI